MWMRGGLKFEGKEGRVGEVKDWIVVPYSEGLLFLDAGSLAEALEVYRKGWVHDAAAVLYGTEAYNVLTRDDHLPKAVAKIAHLGRCVLFRGNVDDVLASGHVKGLGEIYLGILLEGLPEEEEDFHLTIRYSDGAFDYFRCFLCDEDLLYPFAEKPPLEVFPGLEVVGERSEAQ